MTGHVDFDTNMFSGALPSEFGLLTQMSKGTVAGYDIETQCLTLRISWQQRCG